LICSTCLIIAFLLFVLMRVCLAQLLSPASNDPVGSGLSGMFATHLHGILGLPLGGAAKERLVKKRMAYRCRNDGTESSPDCVDGQISRTDVEWTYKLEDGVCTDSLALVTAARFGLPEDVLRRAEVLSDYLDANDSSSLGDTHAKEDAGVASAVEDYSPNGFAQMKHESTGVEDRLTLSDAANVVESIAARGTNEKSAAVRIPPRWMPPASMEGCSCVYVIEVGDNIVRSKEETSGDHAKSSSSFRRHRRRYYVGETDSLSKRLKQHRAKGSNWADATAVVVRISRGGKSGARSVESLVIQTMAQMGFDMVSVADGRTLRSTNALSSSDKRQ